MNLKTTLVTFLAMTPATKRRLIKIAIVAAGFIVTGFLFPWWLLPAVAFSYGFVVTTKQSSAWPFFIDSFASVASAWALTAFVFDARTSFHLSTRIGGMFKLGFPLGGVIAIALIGGLLGALSALAGASIRIGTLRIFDDRA